MNKRGDYNVMFFVFQLVFVAVVLASLLGYANVVGRSVILDQIFLSRDFSHSLISVLSAPGNVEYFYGHPSYDLAKFDIDFGDGFVRVKGVDSNKDSRYFYPVDNKRPVVKLSNLLTLSSSDQRFFRGGPPDFSSFRVHLSKGSFVVENRAVPSLNADQIQFFFESSASFGNKNLNSYDLFTKIELNDSLSQVELVIPDKTFSNSRVLANLIANQMEDPVLVRFVEDDVELNKASFAAVLVRGPTSSFSGSAEIVDNAYNQLRG